MTFELSNLYVNTKRQHNVNTKSSTRTHIRVGIPPKTAKTRRQDQTIPDRQNELLASGPTSYHLYNKSLSGSLSGSLSASLSVLLCHYSSHYPCRFCHYPGHYPGRYPGRYPVVIQVVIRVIIRVPFSGQSNRDYGIAALPRDRRNDQRSIDNDRSTVRTEFDRCRPTTSHNLIDDSELAGRLAARPVSMKTTMAKRRIRDE